MKVDGDLLISIFSVSVVKYFDALITYIYEISVKRRKQIFLYCCLETFY